MRSGTTLLQSILCSDKSTNPLIAESQYFTNLISLYVYGKQSFDNFLADYFHDSSEFKNFSRNWVEIFLKTARQNLTSCTHLVLKNPEMTPLFSHVDELVDDARFLVTVRDPRDTVASILEVARKQARAGVTTNLTMMGRNMDRLCKFYNAYYLPVFKPPSASLTSKMLFLKYEDLVMDSETEIRKIRQFTGLELADYDPNARWKRSRRDYDSLARHSLFGAWVTRLHGGPVSQQGIGRYRQRLNHAEAAEIETRCADVIRMFGY